MNQIHCLFLSVMLTSPLLAQTAVLRGQVTDESKAVIPGAKVTLTGPAGVVKTAAADNNGLYSFAALAPGSYTVQAAAPQLSMPQPAKIALKPGLQTLNLQLTVASIAEKVTVQENSGPAVSTDAASNASAVVLRGDDLLALSDDPNDLQADLQALAGPSAGPGGGAIFIDGFSGGDHVGSVTKRSRTRKARLVASTRPWMCSKLSAFPTRRRSNSARIISDAKPCVGGGVL